MDEVYVTIKKAYLCWRRSKPVHLCLKEFSHVHSIYRADI
ncbi:hypothetical protein HMPREF1548_03986 [Clostridium sp. KLE 1755]|nr:hypothetical protein HMPREF1548_03986 [Clostridium sp. KLE 1755]